MSRLDSSDHSEGPFGMDKMKSEIGAWQWLSEPISRHFGLSTPKPKSPLCMHDFGWGSPKFWRCNTCILEVWGFNSHTCICPVFSERNLQPYVCIYIYIYIYMCAVELKIRPKIALFELKIRPKFSFFFLFWFFFKNILLSAGRMRCFKKIKGKKEFVFLLRLNPSNYVAQYTWTDFQRNLGRIFNSTILLILGLFSFLKKCRNHYFYSVFSPKNENFKPTPKN